MFAMTPEHIAEGLRLLELCAASPDDAQAQCVAAWVRRAMDARPVDPFAARIRGLLSDHALAIVDGDLQRQRETAQAIRQAIASALVPGSSQAH